MNADLKAAREQIEEAIKGALDDHRDWLAENPDEPDPGPDSPCVTVWALQAALTALANAFERGTMPMSHHEITARLLPDTTPEHRALYRAEAPVWPLPNVWLGASIEDQVRADERRQPMAEIAAAGWTTFVSYEPALGEVDWAGWEFLKWLIAGGESGPRARPLHPDWIRIARDWCGDFGVAFFFKQWGTWAPGEANSLRKTLAVDGAHWFDDSWDFVRITAADLRRVEFIDAELKAFIRDFTGAKHDA